jgi:signal transducing adaptor molecule
MHAQPQGQPQLQGQPQFQPQSQPQAQMQAQPQPQAQAQAPPQQQQSGPPYVYDPNGTYPDENATAWARYFAQGGTDPTGAAYFFSVPGVKEAGSAPAPSATDPNAAAAAHRQGSMDTVVAGGYQSQPQVQAQTEPLQRHGTVGSTAPMSPGVDPSAAPQWSAGPTSPIGGAYPQGQPLAAMGSAAPGPYAHDGAAGAVYPPAGIEAGTPGGASQWSGHYQGLPDAMANVSLGPSQEPQPPTV